MPRAGGGTGQKDVRSNRLGKNRTSIHENDRPVNEKQVLLVWGHGVCPAARSLQKLVCARSFGSQVSTGGCRNSNSCVSSEHSGWHSSKRMNIPRVPFQFFSITLKLWASLIEWFTMNYSYDSF